MEEKLRFAICQERRIVRMTKNSKVFLLQYLKDVLKGTPLNDINLLVEKIPLSLTKKCELKEKAEKKISEKIDYRYMYNNYLSSSYQTTRKSGDISKAFDFSYGIVFSSKFIRDNITNNIDETMLLFLCYCLDEIIFEITRYLNIIVSEDKTITEQDVKDACENYQK